MPAELLYSYIGAEAWASARLWQIQHNVGIGSDAIVIFQRNVYVRKAEHKQMQIYPVQHTYLRQRRSW